MIPALGLGLAWAAPGRLPLDILYLYCLSLYISDIFGYTLLDLPFLDLPFWGSPWHVINCFILKLLPAIITLQHQIIYNGVAPTLRTPITTSFGGGSAPDTRVPVRVGAERHK